MDINANMAPADEASAEKPKPKRRPAASNGTRQKKRKAATAGKHDDVPVGTITDAREDKRGLWVKGELPKDGRGDGGRSRDFRWRLLKCEL